MQKNPSLYQINTRVWIKQFSDEINPIKLHQVPVEYWKNLANHGINYVWLMGIWTIPTGSIQKYCFEDDLVKEYKKSLKDWKEEDVIGSPFTLEDYVVNPDLGGIESLKKLKFTLNDLGLKLILDFIPNHFHADSKLVNSNPEIFLQASEKHLASDPYTFFKNNDGKIFAHGRDPFFPAWQDSIQVNYFSERAGKFMIDKLIYISDLCDGVRCDVAMLALTNVFQNTWGSVVREEGNSPPQTEFWSEAILSVKRKKPDFVFMAEVYWEMEYKLQQIGFDFTYDKSLLDRLQRGNAAIVRDHLLADKNYQEKSVRFIENHDEVRAVAALGKEKSKAAVCVMSTIPGMRFYFDGQFEGKKIRLPVQLGREPGEQVDNDLKNFYSKLLSITKSKIFHEGNWSLLDTFQSLENNFTYQNILAWQWKYNDTIILIFVNYSNITSTCRVKLDLEGQDDEIEFHDLLNDVKYRHSCEEILRDGLYIELESYNSHIFSL